MPSYEPLGAGLYRARDTCNAYVLVRGTAALAIDPGSGAWLASLPQLGVERLEWVLLTHTHRDQCAGIYRLDRAVTKLAVPKLERHLVEDVGAFWRSRQVHHNYNQVDDFLSLPRSVPVNLALSDYDDFQWRDLKFQVLPAPGHTPGSIGLLTQLDGRCCAFVGDLIEAPGRVVQIHTLQHAYAGATGAQLLAASLHELMRYKPDRLLPGQGPPIDRPQAACDELVPRLRQLCRRMWASPDTEPPEGFRRLSEHLLVSRSSGCSTYAVLDGTGSAVLIDAGYPDTSLAAACQVGYAARFMGFGIARLMRDHQIKRIEAVLVTHYHDDHVIGVPYLQKRLGSEVWCFDRIGPILEDPTNFNMPCLLPVPICVDRTFADREAVDWGPTRFVFHDMPGQTDLHSGISFDLDGKRWLAVGDSAHLHDGQLTCGHTIFANRVTGQNHLKVARRMLEVAPDVLLHGHPRRIVDGEGRSDTPVTHEDLLAYHHSAEDLAATLRDLVVDQDERRCRADWVRIEPYRLTLQPGASACIELIAENLFGAAVELKIGMICPDGMAVDPPSVSATVGRGACHRSSHRLHLARSDGPSPQIVCADVTVNGKPLGWLGHAQVWTEGTPR